MYTAKECVLLIKDPYKATYKKQDLLQILCKICKFNIDALVGSIL
jgi:hypothetical protein